MIDSEKLDLHARHNVQFIWNNLKSLIKFRHLKFCLKNLSKFITGESWKQIVYKSSGHNQPIKKDAIKTPNFETLQKVCAIQSQLAVWIRWFWVLVRWTRSCSIECAWIGSENARFIHTIRQSAAGCVCYTINCKTNRLSNEIWERKKSKAMNEKNLASI